MKFFNLLSANIVLVLLGTRFAFNDAFEFRHIQLSMFQWQDDNNTGEEEVHNGDTQRVMREETVLTSLDERQSRDGNNKHIVRIVGDTKLTFSGSPRVPESSHRDISGGGDLDEGSLESLNGKSRINSLENRLGNDREKFDGVNTDHGIRRLEENTWPDTNLGQGQDFEQGERKSEQPDKKRKILVIPLNVDSTQQQQQQQADGNKTLREIKSDDHLKGSTDQTQCVGKSILDAADSANSNAPKRKLNDSPPLFQIGQKQKGINVLGVGGNAQLNIDQRNAEEPVDVVASNQNYWVQKYVENKETNIHNNIFQQPELGHVLKRRDVINPPCHTTTTPCSTTTTPCSTTTKTCSTTTTPCPTTTTSKPCSTTTTPCPTTTTPCSTTTTPCPTTTTTCSTTSKPCSTTTTPCPTTTTTCSTTSKPCSTTTTPCPTTTTPCSTTTTPCSTTTKHCSTTTTKPCSTTTPKCGNGKQQN